MKPSDGGPVFTPPSSPFPEPPHIEMAGVHMGDGQSHTKT